MLPHSSYSSSPEGSEDQAKPPARTDVLEQNTQTITQWTSQPLAIFY